MHVVAEETWSWMLLAAGERLFLSVVCGTVAIYTVDLELTAAEIAEYRAAGDAAVARLAAAVHYSPTRFRDRRFADLDRLPGYEAAIAAWRAARDRPSS